MKIALIILAIIAVGIVGILAFAATKPDIFTVQRSLAIKAPPDKIYPLIADFHRWGAWSPYEKKDPAMKRSYGGAPSGKGATYAWDGDKNVGSGSMEMVEATAPSKVGLKLDFTRPFEAHNTVVFSLVPQGDTTMVTWDMKGPTPFMAKIVHVFMNMDKMVGADFETGLANLKAATEN